MALDPKLKIYPEWALARFRKAEDPQDLGEFLKHLKAIGCDWTQPHTYGLPFVAVVPKA